MSRTRPASAVVAVTGGSEGLGQLVYERLLRLASGELEVLTLGAQDPLLATRLRRVSTLVHLATSYDVGAPAEERRALNVGGTQRVLAAARRARVDRVVLSTSVEVYGVQPDNPIPLSEDAPLLAGPDHSLVGDHLEMESLAQQAIRDGIEVTVLRPAALVGGPLGSAYDGALLRQLAGPRLLALRGSEPVWQLCHVEDLAAALEVAALGAVRGVATVACEGWLPQSRVERLSGRRRVELPPGVALSTAERLTRLGTSPAAPRELDRLLAPIVVASEQLRAAGWQPQWTNEAALLAHLATRPMRPTGAYTAAGATVAVVGTAALVRRARRRRRG
ncbi:MAG TPA: NAD-dependent epimerase/dehydratase family protein [Mycobacteriales bacterium]|nr:NAD-dependent epimerase/dehydratase family protein [Mycobacteriales bacterium]